MKSMTTDEIDSAIADLKKYIGYEFTNILFDEKVLQISLSSPETYHWITFSLKPQTYFFVGDSKTRPIKGLKKPLVIFSQTHLKGRRLFGCERLEDEGRVVQLYFSEDKNYFLKLMLFPGGQNIEVQAVGKSMTAFKPRDLGTNKLETDFVSEALRSNSDFQSYWESLPPKRSVVGGGGEKELKNALKKKKNGLSKMEASLDQLKNRPWQKVGEWLKSQSDYSELPRAWKEFVDERESITWNIENIFSQMKKAKSKISGTRVRVLALKSEIEKMEKGQWEKPTATKSLMSASKAKGRTRQLSDGSAFYVGKSGKDNLALLRRAKPWFFWLHIRDYPGAHGILERKKREGEPSMKILQEAAFEVLKQTIKGKPEGPYEILIAECRYVRPIKGGKPGQVTHSHEKVLKITL